MSGRFGYQLGYFERYLADARLPLPHPSVTAVLYDLKYQHIGLTTPGKRDMLYRFVITIDNGQRPTFLAAQTTARILKSDAALAYYTDGDIGQDCPHAILERGAKWLSFGPFLTRASVLLASIH